MQAKIVSITESSDFQNPQIDVVVHYMDDRFPLDHQTPEGVRKFIFTLPKEKITTISESELREMIRLQGVEFAKVLDNVDEKTRKAQELKPLEGIEITIA